MNKNILIIVFILLSFLNTAQAITTLDNSLNATPIIYYSESVDSVYVLNNSDNIQKTVIQYSILNYPFTMVYTFKDVFNNTLKVAVVTDLKSRYPFNLIVSKYSAFFNDVEIIPASYSNTTELTYRFIDISMGIEFVDKSFLIIPYNGDNDRWVDSIKGVFPEKVYFNSITTSNSTAYKLSSISIKYADKGISFAESIITDKYEEMNFIFRFIFTLLSGIVYLFKIITLGYLIDSTDLLNFKIALINPLWMLDQLLSYFFLILKFIIANGVIWFFSITASVLFIISYIQTNGNLLDTFSRFASLAQSFYTTVLIKPAIWIYENILLRIIELIR